MNMLCIITKSDIGGAQRHVLDVATEMKARGHGVEVAMGWEGDWLFDEARAAGIGVNRIASLQRSWNPLRMIAYGFALRKLVLEKRPEIVHFHSSNAIIGALFLPKGTKCVATVHGWSILHPNWRKSRLLKFVYRLFLKMSLAAVDRVVFVSRADEVFNEAVRVTRTTASVVHNGIAPDLYFLSRKEARERLGVSEDEFLVGTLARSNYAKQLGVFYEAAQRTPNARFLNLAEHKEDAPTLLAALDVFALTSRYEGLPYAVLEAALAGVPVVASRVGGIPEIVEDGVSGFLVKNLDAKDFVIAIDRLRTDAYLRETFARVLKATVVERFSRKRMSDTLEALYASI